jgi:hypothetical protein
MIWCDPSQASGALTLPDELALSEVDATRYSPGNSYAYVQTYRDKFLLVPSDAQPAKGMRIAAANLPGFQWVRSLTSKSWWNKTSFYWDPSNITRTANDENDGLTPTTPLLSNDEFRRRTDGRFVPGLDPQTVVVNLLSDCGDNDSFFSNLETAYRSLPNVYVQLLGTVTPLPVGMITAAQALNPAANQANQVTVPGFDFSPHVGRNLRLVGTSGSTAVVAAIEEAVSLGVARVSTQFNGGANPGPGFSLGQQVEIAQVTKVPGIDVSGANVFVQDCRFDKSAGDISLLVSHGQRASLTLARCEMRGVGTTSHNVYAQTFSLNGGSIVGSTWLFNDCSFNTLGSAMINCPGVWVMSSTLRHHPADFGGTNSMLYAYDHASLRLHGNYHCFKLGPNAVGIAMRYGSQAYIAGTYYGAGNDPTSAGICMTGNARFFMQGPAPVMDAGRGAIIDSNDDPVVANNGGTSVAFASLPYPAAAGTLSPRLSAIVFG